jgi:hypothetical protein
MGPLRPQPDFKLPRPRRWSRWAWAVSIAAHVALVLTWVIEGRVPELVKLEERPIVLVPLADSARVVEMPDHVAQSAVGGREPRHQTPPRRLPPAVPVPQVAEVPHVAIPVDTGPKPAPPTGPSRIGRIGPDLGDGLLWVRPLPLPPKELAQRLRKTHTELVDSAVTATIQAFLDSVAREPATATAALPSWTTDIAGKKVGLDQKYIYLGGLKIPAAVLALLPVSGGTNQQKAFDRTNDLLTDLRIAANRATSLAEFKEAIREMQLRRDRQREFERNQRTPPPSDLRTQPPEAGAAPPVAGTPAPQPASAGGASPSTPSAGLRAPSDTTQ